MSGTIDSVLTWLIAGGAVALWFLWSRGRWSSVAQERTAFDGLLIAIIGGAIVIIEATRGVSPAPVVGGAALLVSGTGLFIWQLRSSRRGRGPR